MTTNTTLPAHLLTSRFVGVGNRLEEALAGQLLLTNVEPAQRAVSSHVTVEAIDVGQILIRQDDVGTDLFFTLSGRFRVLVNGREVATRHAGTHVGEMALIDPSSRRTATVIASEPSVVARISEQDFLPIADRYPAVWRAIAKELSRRLDSRKQFHLTPNAVPNIFLGSSSESLPIAMAVRDALPKSIANCILWSQGVFGASTFPIDDLEAQLKLSDFAVLVVANDDTVISRSRRAPAPRDNVVFELGLFMGGLSRRRAFLLPPRGTNVKIPTDLLGLNTLSPYNIDASGNPDVTRAAEELARVIQQEGSR